MAEIFNLLKQVDKKHNTATSGRGLYLKQSQLFKIGPLFKFSCIGYSLNICAAKLLSWLKLAKKLVIVVNINVNEMKLELYSCCWRYEIRSEVSPRFVITSPVCFWVFINNIVLSCITPPHSGVVFTFTSSL